MKQIRLSKQLALLALFGLAFSLFCLFPLKSNAAEPDIQAKAAIAVDAKTGKIFYAKNAEEPLPIASMTKLLTLYLVLDAIDNGTLHWEEPVPITDHLLSLSQDLNLSNIPFTPTGTYTVKDLFVATEVVSANAAAIALAEKVAGSEKDFVDQMRAKVSEWGIKDSYLISTSGINNEDAQGQIYPGSQPHEENLMSAKDMAIVAQHLLTDHPEFLAFSKEATTTFAPNTPEELQLESWNWMLPGLAYEKEGVDGLKTGTTELAGACFTGTSERDGWRIITVVLNAGENDEEADNGTRFIETGKLMDYVYANWRYEPLVKKGQPVPGFPTIAVDKGKQLDVPVVASKTVHGWVQTNLSDEQIKYQGHLKKALLAPVSQQTKAGTISLSFPQDTLGFLSTSKQSLSVPVKTKQAVLKASWWERIKRSFQKITG